MENVGFVGPGTEGRLCLLSGEWIDWEPYASHLPRELARMKSHE